MSTYFAADLSNGKRVAVAVSAEGEPDVIGAQTRTEREQVVATCYDRTPAQGKRAKLTRLTRSCFARLCDLLGTNVRWVWDNDCHCGAKTEDTCSCEHETNENHPCSCGGVCGTTQGTWEDSGEEG